MTVKSIQMFVLLTSMFIFTLGFGIVVPILAYFTKDMGATPLDVGILMSLFSAMEFIFAPAWGRISDRIGRKPVMLIGLLGFGVFFALTGLSGRLWEVYVAQSLAGLFTAGIFPAGEAYAADITTHDERRKVMGYLGAAFGLGMIVGPAISSIAAIWGLTVPFFVAAGTALVTFAVALVFLPESRKCATEKVRAPSKMPILSIIRSPLGALMFLMLFISFAISCIDDTMAFFVMDKFGMSDVASHMPVLGGGMMLTGPNVTGIMFVCMGIILVVCQGVLVDRIACRFGEARTVVAGFILVATGMALLLGVFDLVTLLLATCLMSVGSGLINPCVSSMVSNRSGPDRQGASMGVLGSFNSLGRVMGPTVGGLVYMSSVFALYAGTAVIAALCAVGFMRWDRRQRDGVKVDTAQEQHN